MTDEHRAFDAKRFAQPRQIEREKVQRERDKRLAAPGGCRQDHIAARKELKDGLLLGRIKR